jgi:MFS transporter, DHA2 family, multidrug resistance protein
MSPAQEHTAEHYSKFGLVIVVMCSMAGTLMQALDTTIANVALPYMRGSLSASQDQITWVLTSYVVAAAIMTAPVGWLAARYGKKNVLTISLIGFTVTSVMCGFAQSLNEMVIFRLLQGMFGAALSPLSQSVMLDLYPIEKRGQVMAIWGMGVMLGPILGPTLGGYLTDAYDWRWVFFINVPFGIAASAGLLLIFKDSRRNAALKFDWMGFAFIGLAIGALQMMLDRGTTKDWFSSSEIVAEAVLAGLGFYLFLVHMMTSNKTFIPKQAFYDRNLVSGLFLMFVVGAVLLASTALIPTYLQTLGGYSVTQAGLLLGPRGVGTMVAMMIVGRIANKSDPRVLMSIGTAILAWSLWEMSRWTPDIAIGPLLTTTIIQGFGMGMVFVPLQLVAFATLPGNLRTDGAAMMNLIRNVGSAIGVSVAITMVTDSEQILHAQYAAYASPFNRALGVNGPSMYYNTQIPFGLQNFDSIIQMRASIDAYSNAFLFMFYATLPAFLIIWMLRRPAFSSGNASKPAQAEQEHAVAME